MSNNSSNETLTIKSLKPASHFVSKTIDQKVLQFWKNIIEPKLEAAGGKCIVTEEEEKEENVYNKGDLRLGWKRLGKMLGYTIETNLYFNKTTCFTEIGFAVDLPD